MSGIVRGAAANSKLVLSLPCLCSLVFEWASGCKDWRRCHAELRCGKHRHKLKSPVLPKYSVRASCSHLLEPIFVMESAQNGASFAATIAPNTWITIFGKVLSISTRPWKGDDFVGTRLPTQIENVSVTIGGRPAYVYYINPAQLNALTPPDLPEGAAIVEVTRGGVKSEAVSVLVQHVAPALFMFDPENRRSTAATHVDNTLVGKTSLYEGASTPAHPGEVITLWGAGFGRTDPAIPEGQIASGGRPLIAQPVVTIGNVRADVLFAGLTAAGLYQFNVRVPDSLPDGDQPVAILVEGSTTQENAFVTVQR
jgi:uncharacterized protein (TIGR03437 family)